VELGVKEWFGLRVVASDVQLWECNIFLFDDEAHLLFSWPATAVVHRFAQLSFSSLRYLMCCGDVYGVAQMVHKCMQIVGAAAVPAARQQPR
jgi:hypothetical protein